MKKRKYVHFAIPACLLILFALYTIALMYIDVKPIGPKGSLVGFATINRRMQDFFGVNMSLYQITDWASIAAILLSFGFAVFGIVQLIKRKSLLRVDRSILILGGFYLLVIAAYLFFEMHAINFRPVLINGFLETSYPSSTTMLVMCIMPTAMMQFNRLIRHNRAKIFVQASCAVFTILMVAGRMFSGVHWFTDILGGALLSAALVVLYYQTERLICSASLQQ